MKIDGLISMTEIGFGATVMGLLNSMMGAGCLALPVIALAHGTPIIIATTLLVGVVSMYTAYLIVVHIGTAPSIKEALLYHFDHDPKYLKVYSGGMWIKFIVLCIYFFKLTCLQITGLLGK